MTTINHLEDLFTHCCAPYIDTVFNGFYSVGLGWFMTWNIHMFLRDADVVGGCQKLESPLRVLSLTNKRI